MLPECGQLLGEERVGVGDGLVEGTRKPPLERATVCGPEDAAKERVDGSLLVSRVVALDRGVDELAAEGGLKLRVRCGSRGVHGDHRVDGIRGIEGQLECDRDARGVADDVGLLDPELAHEQHTVARMVGHRHRPLGRAAASEPCAVVADEAVAVSEGGLLQERLRPCRAHSPMDQHDGRSRSSELVRELETLDGCSLPHLHDSLPRLAEMAT